MKKLVKTTCKVLGTAILSTTLLTACVDRYNTGGRAGTGALIGAGTGAAIGALAGGGRGAAIGALTGGAVGAGVGAATTPKRPRDPYYNGYDRYNNRYNNNYNNNGYNRYNNNGYNGYNNYPPPDYRR